VHSSSLIPSSTHDVFAHLLQRFQHQGHQTSAALEFARPLFFLSSGHMRICFWTNEAQSSYGWLSLSPSQTSAAFADAHKHRKGVASFFSVQPTRVDMLPMVGVQYASNL
jgi:hypothetical protein